MSAEPSFVVEKKLKTRGLAPNTDGPIHVVLQGKSHAASKLSYTWRFSILAADDAVRPGATDHMVFMVKEIPAFYTLAQIFETVVSWLNSSQHAAGSFVATNPPIEKERSIRYQQPLDMRVS